MSADVPAVRMRDVHKRFRMGFVWNRTVHAVRGLSLEVQEGEIVGFLGPNGAGKTTTLKMLLGLIHPSSGSIDILGRPLGHPTARAAIGFLPENPYFYGYLDAWELLDLKGRLHGLSRQARRSRADALLDRVGLGHTQGRPLRNFSKGMLQRAGLAQALMGDPKVVLLDEPQTGLDPLGRKEVRDLIKELRDEGRTVFFSSHVLADVEAVCDRVALIVGGQLREMGPLSSLVSPKVVSAEVVIEGGADPDVGDALRAQIERTRVEEGAAWFRTRGPDAADALVREAVRAGLKVRAVIPHKETLEDVFVRETAS